jgi:hypothetical protein
MEGLGLVAAGLTLAGALLPLLFRRRLANEFGAAPDAGGAAYLLIFAGLAAVFGLFCITYYWRTISARADDAIFLVGLFLAMIAGMLVQVVAMNYRQGRGLFSVNRDQVVFPTLFAIMVFYPIWAVAAAAPKGFFVVHAAFLNGYFWESIVSSAKPPTRGEPPRQ